MPHFDQYGGDEWICQVCCRVFNSRVNSTWLPIPGRDFSGNVCPTCLPAPIDNTPDDPAELRLQRELDRLGLRNAPAIGSCPHCGAALTEVEHGGMVGELVAVCPEHGIVWEDQEDAIRRVI